MGIFMSNDQYNNGQSFNNAQFSGFTGQQDGTQQSDGSVSSDNGQGWQAGNAQAFPQGSQAYGYHGGLTVSCPNCGQAVDPNAVICLNCGAKIPVYIPGGKSRVAAGILGIFLGGFGVHKFYMGKIGMGILYLLFCWTFIPGLIGFVEGIIYLCEDDAKFASRLNQI